MREQEHAGLTAYLRRNGMDQGSQRSDGALVLIFDGQYRIYFRPAPKGALALETRLLPLDPERAAADRQLALALDFAMSRIVAHAQALVLSGPGTALMLQQVIGADADQAVVEGALEDFVNAVASWQSVMATF